jgi:hypothetical protein
MTTLKDRQWIFIVIKGDGTTHEFTATGQAEFDYAWAWTNKLLDAGYAEWADTRLARR